MFGTVGELEEVAERLAIPADEQALATVVRALSTVQAKLAAAMAVFDEHKLWDASGATSMTGWLRDHGMTGAAARRMTATATRVAGLPATASAWTEGKLSVGQVEVIAAHLRNPDYIALFAEHEADTIPSLVGLSIHETGVAMKEWREKADAILDRPEPVEHDRELHHSKTLEGTWGTRGSFGPLAGEVVDTALRLATTEDVEGVPRRTPSQKRADALRDVCQFFLDHQHRRPSHRHRPHLNVVVRSDGNGGWHGQLLDRTPLCQVELQTLVCDSTIHRFLTDDNSTILDYGVGKDTVPMGLFNAIQTRDRGCRFPGCDRPPQWCDVHHLKPRADGGPTNPANLALFCNRHHHLIHRRRWRVVLTSNGDLEVTGPDGITRRSRAPGTLTA